MLVCQPLDSALTLEFWWWRRGCMRILEVRMGFRASHTVTITNWKSLTLESVAKSANPCLVNPCLMKGKEPMMGREGGPGFSWWKLFDLKTLSRSFGFQATEPWQHLGACELGTFRKKAKNNRRCITLYVLYASKIWFWLWEMIIFFLLCSSTVINWSLEESFSSVSCVGRVAAARADTSEATV